jgi:hypothetical protein
MNAQATKGNTSVKRVIRRVKWGNVLRTLAFTSVIVMGGIIVKIAPSKISAPLNDPAVKATYKMDLSSTVDDSVDYDYLAFMEKQNAQKAENELKEKADILAKSDFTYYNMEVGHMLDSFDIVEVYAPEQYVGKKVAIYNVTDNAGLGEYVGTYTCVGENTDGIKIVVNNKGTYDSIDSTISNHIYVHTINK